MNTMAATMGDYATRPPWIPSWRPAATSTPPTWRCWPAPASYETEDVEGQTWAEAKVKLLTGGDPITARFMRQDNFTFLPNFKLTVSGNHKPALNTVDDAIRRRLNLAPFLHRPANPDRPDRLKQECPGDSAVDDRGLHRVAAVRAEPA